MFLFCFLFASHLSNLLCSGTSLVLHNLDNSTGCGNTAHDWGLLEIPDNDRSADLIYFYTFTFIHVTGHSLQLIRRKRKDEALQVWQKSVVYVLERQRKLRVALWEAGPDHLHFFLLLFLCPAVRCNGRSWRILFIALAHAEHHGCMPCMLPVFAYFSLWQPGRGIYQIYYP